MTVINFPCKRIESRKCCNLYCKEKAVYSVEYNSWDVSWQEIVVKWFCDKHKPSFELLGGKVLDQ